jgi:hypothetical protein
MVRPFQIKPKTNKGWPHFILLSLEGLKGCLRRKRTKARVKIRNIPSLS